MRSRVLGDDQPHLEPQPWAMWLPGLPAGRAQALWTLIRERMCEGKGVRQREHGFRCEQGGIWYALNGPLALAVADVDRDGAEDLLERMSLRRHARDFPDNWIGQWSASDCWQAAADPQWPNQAGVWKDPAPVFCCHAHAWPLAVWQRLRSGH